MFYDLRIVTDIFMSIKPRDLIRDNHGREGIVIERAKTPSRAWISDQKDQRVRSLSLRPTWWRVFCVSGGSVIVPEELAQFIRSATLDDARRACECANEPALRSLAALFPELVKVALKRREANKDSL